MSKLCLLFGLLAAMLLSGACSQDSNGPISAEPAEPCDRACLEGFVDQYLAALLAHDASQLPLTENARYTAFTNALLKILHLGVPDGPETLNALIAKLDALENEYPGASVNYTMTKQDRRIPGVPGLR